MLILERMSTLPKDNHYPWMSGLVRPRITRKLAYAPGTENQNDGGACVVSHAPPSLSAVVLAAHDLAGHVEAAVDVDDVAGHERRGIGGQEQHNGRDLFRLTEPTHRR